MAYLVYIEALHALMLLDGIGVPGMKYYENEDHPADFFQCLPVSANRL